MGDDKKATSHQSQTSTPSTASTSGTSGAVRPAVERGEFDTRPDRANPYTTTDIDTARTFNEKKYQESIKGEELPPSVEEQQQIDAEREAEQKQAQQEAQQPDSYQQALATGNVGLPPSPAPASASTGTPKTGSGS